MGANVDLIQVQLSPLNPPRWVQLISSSLGPYVSSGPSDQNTGTVAINAAVGATYTLRTGPSRNGPWTTEDSAYVVSEPPVGSIANSSFFAANPPSLKGNYVWHNVITDYGAKGDGVTLDTTAIQNAITTANGKGLVFFPEPATSFLTAMLTIPSGTTLWGTDLPILKLKNSANTNLLQFNDVAHTDTHITGLYLDGNAANQAASSSDVIGFPTSPTTLSHNRTIVEGCYVLNAGRHAIFLSEATAGQSNNPKFIRHNVISGHGESGATGFGIYVDYCGNSIIEGNFITNTHAYDCIEMGHAGPGWLTSLGSNTCVYNIVKGGQIQFPFSDNCRIEGNFVLNSKISNDLNTANNVAIIGNTVWAPGTSIPATASGINATGANPIIEGNYVSVGQNDGIGDASHAMSGARITGNIVSSTNAGNNGTGIHASGNTNGTSDDCIAADNLVTGKFVTGMDFSGSNCIVHDNRIALTGGTSGIKIPGSSALGWVGGINGNIHDNTISGVTAPLTLPIVGTDGSPAGLLVHDNPGVFPPATNGFAAGLPAVAGAQTAAVATLVRVNSYNDSSKHLYRVSGTVTITTLGSAAINLQVTYTDDSGAARTCTIPLCAEAGAFAAAANTADSWKGSVMILVNPNTLITMLTAGTFTGGTYNVSGVIEAVA